MPETLIEMLQRAAARDDRGYTFLDDALRPREWSFAELLREAERRGRYFRSLGLEKGDRLALIIPDGQDFVLSFLGAIRAGIVPVPMYPPLALGKLDGYVETARKIMTSAGVKMLLTSKPVSGILWSLVSRVPSLEDIHTVEKVSDHEEAAVTASLEDLVVRGDDICFLQFTSGSTSDPKGVVVTHANLVANAKAILLDGLEITEEDNGVSWLPLFHDMGLIGFVIAPLLTQIPIVFIPTLTFVKRPNVWMETISKYRATITFAPNFAFGLAAKRATPQRVAAMDLSSLRVVGCGAEPINAETMRTFAEAFSPAGFNINALMPAYGMAEATLAISFDDLESPFDTLTIDRDQYEADRVAAPTTSEDPASRMELVACGRTFPNHEVGVMSDAGELLPEGQVGELVF
ncbi:MAG: AMP-binding protein, partial [Myxococcota bacterium]